MKSENPQTETASHVWFEILMRDLTNIRKCMDDDSSIQISRLNFRSALNHSTTEHANLSHLLARLQDTLKLISSCAVL